MRHLLKAFAIGLFAAVTPATAHQAASPPASPPPSPPPSVAPLVQMDHIQVQMIGFGGDPVVLIPGLGTPQHVWGPFVLRLADRHRVILVQVNGFGGPGPGGDLPNTNIDANRRDGLIAGIVRDLSAYIERERLGPVSIVGHSMGGLVGMMMARDHAPQVRRLMVVDALPWFGALMPGATIEGMRDQAARMRTMIADAPATPPSASDPSVAIMSNTPAGRLQVSTWSQGADRRVVAQALYEDLITDLRGDVARIGAVPTTVLHVTPPGLSERATALYRQAYAAGPSIRLVAIPDAYHFIMLDQPDRFRAELDAFLSR